MSTYSEYKGLELPTSPEHYDIAVVNKNNMVIDSELHKLDLKNESQDQLLATKEALNSEISRAGEKENEILEKLNDEIIRAEASDNEIMDLLENEINRATAAEKTNANNLAVHIADEDNPHKVTPDIIGAVNKSGDTMTGNLTIEKNTANQSAYFTAKRTDTNTTVGFGVGSGGVNHGVYSTTLGKWIVYADDSKVYLNGNAETATKAEYLNVHSIAANTDLNSVTSAGLYRCIMSATAMTLQNCPTKRAFFMVVGTHAGVYQEVVEYLTTKPQKYMRNYYSGTWGSWYKVYTEADKPTPSDIGAVNKTGDTMSGYLYSTAGTSTDGRKTRLYNNGIRFMFPNTAAGGLYFGSLDENTYFSTMGYYHNSLAPENNYFYCGSTYNNPDGKVKAGEFIGNLTGTASAASRLADRGNVTAETGTNVPAVTGLSMSRVYNNGYPLAYGNVITAYGTGIGELLLGWSGTNGSDAHLYYRNKRDVAVAEWSSWKKIAFTDDDITGNAETATKLATARTIDGVSFNGSAAITHYGTCSTASATVAKVVACTGFTLVTGAEITVKFTVTNTASNPTLNVNGTGAKAIQYRGAAISAGYLAANRTYRFLYDGTYYQLIGDINTDTTTASKLGTATVGSGTKPIYLNAGTATASTSTVGSSTRPVYMNAGTVTQCETSLGVDITGNAATATKATQDGDGNVIADSYVKILENNSVIVGGTDNEIINKGGAFLNNVIIGGRSNILDGNNSGAPFFYNTIIGGNSNTIIGGCYNSTIIAGSLNKIIGSLNTDTAVIIAGCNAQSLAYQVVTGHYNDITKATAGTVSGTGTGTAFCIGNGTSSAASNAARIDYNGKLWCKAAYSSTGADYAELFEWTDGNPDNEDRRGYFVTMDGDKIKKASTGDWILGVVSANPCVLGNTDMEWNGQFLKDEFGAFLTEEFTEKQKRVRVDQITNDNGDPEDVEVEYEEEVTGIRYVLNPEYDPERAYEDRISRPEWDAIGMMGVLSVYDDGSCQVNGFCSCNNDGIATASETGYRVIQRLNDNIIKIVFK